MLSKWSPVVLSFAAACVFFINLCAWIFKCGCNSLWAGADMACNIHMAHARHCPFCAHGWAGQAVVMIAIAAAQVFVSFRAPWPWFARLAAGLAVFPVVEALVALVFGWVDRYWTR